MLLRVSFYLLFFFAEILLKSPRISVFDPIFPLSVHYPLISNMASAVIKIFYLFLMSSIVSIDFIGIYACSFKSV